jgi:hypothetical protein
MPVEKREAWAVEYIKEGKTTVILDYTHHSNPEEAIQAFESSTDLLWEDAKEVGARVVKRLIFVGLDPP